MINILNMDIENANNFPELCKENLTNKKGKVVVSKPVASPTRLEVRPVIMADTRPTRQIKRRPCETILKGEKCTYGSRCTFVHSLSELFVDECMHGRKCYLIREKETCIYENSGERCCTRLHPDESLINFHRRVDTKKYIPNLPEEIPKFNARCTKMCRTFLQGVKCEFPECYFAHTLEELVWSDCGFKDKCIHVEKGDEGVYTNVDAVKKVCMRRHPDETILSIVKRRAEEPEKPSYSLFPEGTRIKVENGKTHISTPQKDLIKVFHTALEKGIRGLSVSAY